MISFSYAKNKKKRKEKETDEKGARTPNIIQDLSIEFNMARDC